MTTHGFASRALRHRSFVIGAVLTLMGNMLADVGYALVDPRIRTG